MLVLPSRVVRVAIVVLFAMAFPLCVRPVRAQAKPITVTSVSAQYRKSDPYDVMYGVLTFQVKNVSGATQTFYIAGSCGVFRYPDIWDADGYEPGYCDSPYPNVYTLAAGQTVSVNFAIYTIDSQAGDVTLTLSPTNGSATSATAHVSWTGASITSNLVESTFTPAAYDYGTLTISPSVRATQFAFTNRGNADGVFTFGTPVCTGAITACAVSPASVSVSAGAVGYFYLYFTPGALGQTGQVSIPVVAPPRATGLVEQATTRASYSIADLAAPTIALTPAGLYNVSDDTFDPVWLTTRQNLTVDVCDPDGVVATPVLQLGTATVGASSVTPTTVGGCSTAKRAMYSVPFVSGANAVTVTVSDGYHTTTAYQVYKYDDTPDHRARVVAAHATPPIQTNRVAADTFFVTNPGWHSVQYTLTSYCTYEWAGAPTCSFTLAPPAQLTVAAGATVAVPISYMAPPLTARATTVSLTAAYSTSMGTSSSGASIRSTTASMLPPQVTITPSDGSMIATPTTNVSLSWCDPDDGLTSLSLTSAGQAIAGTTNVTTVAGCVSSGTTTWTNVPLVPWQHTFVATAVDQAGHSTVVSSTVAYAPPISAYKPSVGPKALARLIPGAGLMVDTFTVTNAGSLNATYQITPMCGAHAGCGVDQLTLAVAPSRSANVVLSYPISAGGVATDTVRLIARYQAPNGSAIADTGSRILSPATYTVAAYPKSTIFAARRSATGYQITIYNRGSGDGTFSLAPPTCSGALSACSLSVSSVFVPAGGSGVSYLNFTTGEVGTSGTARVLASSPPRVSGLIERDSAMLTVNVADLVAPTIALSPAGALDADQQSTATVDLQSRAVVTVDVCDADGTVGTPALALNGVPVAATSVVQSTVTGCNSAKHATYAPPFQGGNNQIVVTVSDGTHTTTAAQTYRYDDSSDEIAVISVAHAAISVPINRTAADTFWVKNAGWHSAHYTLGLTCTIQSTPTSLCNTPSIPSAIDVGPSGSVAVPFTYAAGGTANLANVFTLTANYTGAAGSSRASASIASTPILVLAPTISVTPNDGAVVTTPTFTLTVDWCDDDDAIVQRTITWEGRALPTPTSGQPPATCLHGTRSVWYQLPIDLWQQSLVATAIDQSGHTTTRALTIAYAPPLAEFKPRVVPLSATERTRLNTAAADTFTVTNAGTHTTAYALTASCGRLANCTSSLSAVTLAPSTSANVVVGFTTSGAVDVKDSIALVATYTSPIASAIADTGRAIAVVPSIEAAPAITTSVGVETAQPTWVGQAIYTVTNRSSVAETYRLAITVAGGWDFPNWYVRDSILTLEAGQSKDVWVYTKAPASEGVTGSFTLAASYVAMTGAVLSASATSRWMTQTPRPGLAVTPKNTTQTYTVGQSGLSATFTLTATGNQGLAAQAAFECDNGAVCRWATNPLGSVNLVVGAPQSLRVAFDSVSTPFHIKLRAFGAIGPDTTRDSASISMVPSGKYLAAAVSPKSRTITENPSRQIVQIFYITNRGNVNGTFQYAASCDGAIANTCQLVDHTSALLTPNQRDSVWVLLTTPAQLAQSGNIVFNTRAVGDQLTAVDTGRVKVSTGAVVDLAVNAKVRDARATIARDQCLTVAVGEHAAFECGDLRLVHPLPATMTMAKSRGPTLIYESRHHSALALIAADVTVAPGLPVSSITAHVIIDGHASVDTTVAWNNAWSDGRPRRIVVRVDASALTTNAYHYTFSVDAVGPISHFEQQDDGVVAIVNRARGQFGPGWWLDGFEELKSYSATQMFWVGGDGSTRLYTKSAVDTIWTVTPSLDRPDVLIHRPDGSWVRRLRNRAYVEFDATLRHVATVNAQGHRTTFVYGDAAHTKTLTAITLPVPPQSTAIRQYVFEHDPSTQYLTRVTAPSPAAGFQRRTTVEFVAVNGTPVVKSITDPDGSKVTYTPDTKGRVAARVNRRSYVTSFLFDEGLALKRSTLDVAGTAASNVVHTFCAAETASVSSCAPTLVSSDSVVTWLDGPRDVGDTTWFALNEFGAPRLIVNALHDTTFIERGDAAWPMLATKVTQPNKHVTRAEYDPVRALLTKSIDVSPFGGGDAITRYDWDSVWDKLSVVTPQAGGVVKMGYDDVGNRRWQKDGRGDSTTVRFDYTANNQLEFITAPGASAPAHLEYDPILGNVLRSTSPLGVVTQTMRDWLGRDSLITSPGATNGAVTTEGLVYDAADRVVIDSTRGAETTYLLPTGRGGISGTAAATILKVITSYDSAGAVKSVTRVGTPGQSLTTLYDYDAAMRKIGETDAHSLIQHWAYDAAGNDTAWTTRRGFTIAMRYDTLNRLTRRIVPRALVDSEVCTTSCTVGNFINPQPIQFPYFQKKSANGALISGVLVPADTARFVYDKIGNMLAAENADAKVHRGYFPNGALAADTLMIGVYDRVEVPGGDPFTGHVYVQKYTYDPNGRRAMHSATFPSLSSQLTYHYEPGAGLLDSIFDGATHIGFAYDAAARQIQRVVFGSGSTTLTDARVYDDDNRPYDRVEKAGPTLIYHNALQYDQRGKVLVADIESSLPDVSGHFQFGYNGVGSLVASSRDRGDAWTDEYTVDAFANVLRHEENRNVETWRRTENLQGLEQLISNSVALPGVLQYEEPAIKRYTRIDAQSADLSGNITGTRSIASQWRPGTFNGIGTAMVFDDVFPGSSFTRSYYGADEKLRVFQRSEYQATGGPITTFVEYRYDALGRRVLVRTQRTNSCGVVTTPECLSTVDRFVWDGDQLLAELRAAVSPSAQGAALETEATFGSDVEGAVRYTHGGALDQPLLVWKSGPRGLWGIVPHLSWRGGFEAGSFLDGSPTPFYWSARDREPYLAPDARVTPPSITTWVGSLMDGQVDASGLVYMRNRYYDPKVGKFTQEDPIGLAGGMNLYGFAGGDPVNYSDPLGLCPPIEDCLQQIANWGARKGGATGSFALNGAAALNSINDVNPLSTAFDAGYDIGDGHVGRGLAMAALTLFPGGGEGRLVVGKVAALEAEGALGAGERTLLPKLAGSLGNPKANWARNAGVLRAEMSRGLPIRDASVNPVTGALENNTGFLRAERQLFQDRGWSYDASTRLWNPPR